MLSLMMKNCILTVEQMTRADNTAIAGGIPADQLMEAGAGPFSRKSRNAGSRTRFWFCVGRATMAVMALSLPAC
jgi:NAD(P)H-hydrate repair Nnr-like enzyme with NAD(P)H-hydrate epimerase domain